MHDSFNDPKAHISSGSLISLSSEIVIAIASHGMQSYANANSTICSVVAYQHESNFHMFNANFLNPPTIQISRNATVQLSSKATFARVPGTSCMYF